MNAGGFVLAGDSKKVFATNDGLNWQASEMSAKGNIVWSDGTRFIGSNWPGKMTFSKDGKTWENANEMTANGINRVVKAESK